MGTENEPKPDESVQPAPVKTAGLGGLSLDDFILLNEEIAGMARAGLPLDQGLTVLAQEMGRGKLRRVTGEIAQDLQAGLTLPQAIERQEGRLPAFYAKLLSAGIRAGKVTDVISTLTAYARTLANLRAAVLDALLYPATVLVLSLILFGVVSTYLMPQFAEIFQTFKIKLPALTVLVFYVFDHALFFFVGLPGLVVGALLLLRAGMHRTPEGRQSWARFWYAVPIVGVLLRSSRLAAFADLLGILVDNGVPLPEAFLLAGRASTDPLMVAGAEQVHEGLCQGTPLGIMLHEQSLMPTTVVWMVGVGEKRGTLGATLHQVADTYRRQAEMRANLLRNLLPPLLVLFVAGFVVITYVLTLMLPIMSLLEGLGGGKK